MNQAIKRELTGRQNPRRRGSALHRQDWNLDPESHDSATHLAFIGRDATVKQLKSFDDATIYLQGGQSHETRP